MTAFRQGLIARFTSFDKRLYVIFNLTEQFITIKFTYFVVIITIVS